MIGKRTAVGIGILLIFITLMPMFGNGEIESITTEDPETPLIGEPKYVEVGRGGDLVIVTFTRNYGITLIHRNNDTMQQIMPPEIESGDVYQIHYNEDDNVLFAITGSGYQASRTTLETIWLSNGTIQRMWLNYNANIINDLEYNANTNTLYLGCSDGLWIIDVVTQNITSKLDENSGLKARGIADFFQEPTENLLWFSTGWTLSDMNIQTLDMSSNTINTEFFNFTDIVNKSGYLPFRGIYSLLYDVTTRDIYVAFQFNKSSTDGYYYLACFDRDDTSKFVPLPSWFLSQGREVTRSGGDQVYIESRILDIHPRNSAGDGPFFQGERLGLFYYDLPEVKLSNEDKNNPVNYMIKLFLEEVMSLTLVYDEDTEEYNEMDLKYVVPEFEWIHDLAISQDDGTVVITDSDGISITDIDESLLIEEPYGFLQFFLFTIHHEVPEWNLSGLPKEICRSKAADEIEAAGHLTIQTQGVNDQINMLIISHSKLTITDSEGNVIANREGNGEPMKLVQELEDLPSSVYTVRLENRDALGRLVEHKESKFILDNPNVKADSENDSKLSEVAVPVGIGIAAVLILAAAVATGITLSKKNKDKISEEKKEE